ncbi:AAA family ATPase [Photobacterium atrarenae]|uniref:AAA family ATPase n=1 Tax=Photobacterium atrarenae TaxID=865757 RepID=A0ABY5GN78_9GAMM|nr:AAA family ATPase [Photobacterium atrarenae]UTV30265.1 AAA family ATPase [Photobacterium atrarenae]
MNNQSIKFLSVTIRNFRGIPRELTIPLDAPLTVIHAANGTGKSTVCYALEWLLTGKVEDLANTSDFACQWGQGETSVSATCLIGGEPHELTRKGNSIWISENGAKKKKIKGADLLNLLTPVSVSGRSSQAISKAKRGWLRNSRWLYSNSLSLLIDNNKAEERQQIFADILGLGHLTSTLRDLRDYRKQLPSTKGLQDSVIRLSTEISEIEGKLAESKPWKERASSHLSKILEAFPQITATRKLGEDFKLAQLQVRIFDQRVQHSLDILRLLSGQWEQYNTEQKQLNKLRQTLADLSKINEIQSQKHTELSAELSAEEVKAAEGSRSVIWAKECLDVLNRWEQVISLPSIKAFFLSEKVSQGTLQQQFVECSWTADKQEAWLQSVNYLIQNSATVADLVQQKQDLASNIVHPPTDIVNINHQAEEAKVARVKAESEFNALSSVLDKLKAMGKEITHSHDGGQCPLCDHDWGSSDKLRQQIENEALLTPELKDAAQKQAKAQKVERDAVARLTLANNQRVSYEAYVARIVAVDNQLASIEQRTKYLEIINVHDFSNFNEANLQHLKSRIDAAIDLRLIFESLEKVESLFESSLVEGVGQRISKARENLTSYTDHYQSQADLANSAKLRLSPLVLGVMESITANSREIEGVKSNIAAITHTVNGFDARWKEVVGEDAITLELLNSTLKKVEDERIQVVAFKSMLAECEAVVNIDLDSGPLTKLKIEKEELSKKLEAGNKYITEADNTIDSYAHHVKKLTSSSLAPLLEPAGELFSRMHANEVYKGLSVSDGEALKWTVFADGHEFALDAEERFSQGQRQDLALSLYLARARNTGGSFFLDEPIAHLDDLNRVAMLDILRLVATSMPNMNLILTTASDSLARHLTQKFSSITDRHLLSMIHLEGNPRTGVSKSITTNVID